jgi:hypothetical protein
LVTCNKLITRRHQLRWCCPGVSQYSMHECRIFEQPGLPSVQRFIEALPYCATTANPFYLILGLNSGQQTRNCTSKACTAGWFVLHLYGAHVEGARAAGSRRCCTPQRYVRPIYYLHSVVHIATSLSTLSLHWRHWQRQTVFPHATLYVSVLVPCR